MSNWTQPVCMWCYREERGENPLVVVRDTEHEVCCKCGVVVVTAAGIYIRVDPATVMFPRKEM